VTPPPITIAPSTASRAASLASTLGPNYLLAKGDDMARAGAERFGEEAWERAKAVWGA
jgi:hypothetical protein